MVYGIQMNKLGHMGSMQKLINQTDLSGLRYEQKRDSLVCAKPNLHVLAYISSWGDWYELSILALKHCALACSFEDHKTYIFTY
jgi:hypothetical protein